MILDISSSNWIFFVNRAPISQNILLNFNLCNFEPPQPILAIFWALQNRLLITIIFFGFLSNIFFWFFLYFVLCGDQKIGNNICLFFWLSALYSKFCKDKQNQTSETTLLDAWLIWNSVSAANPFNRTVTIKTMYNLVIVGSQFGILLNSVFGWVNLKFHLVIRFNQNLKNVLPDSRVWTFFFFWEFSNGRVLLTFLPILK